MSLRVLIADPDKYLLSVYREQLAAEGFNVSTAQDGLECLEKVRQFRPDVLVLEPTIPWGGGDGIVTLIHEDPEISKIPLILVLTAGCSTLALYNVARFPISDYMGKPVSGSFLTERIRAALARGERQETTSFARVG